MASAEDANENDGVEDDDDADKDILLWSRRLKRMDISHH